MSMPFLLDVQFITDSSALWGKYLKIELLFNFKYLYLNVSSKTWNILNSVVKIRNNFPKTVHSTRSDGEWELRIPLYWQQF